MINYNKVFNFKTIIIFNKYFVYCTKLVTTNVNPSILSNLIFKSYLDFITPDLLVQKYPKKTHV